MAYEYLTTFPAIRVASQYGYKTTFCVPKLEPAYEYYTQVDFHALIMPFWWHVTTDQRYERRYKGRQTRPQMKLDRNINRDGRGKYAPLDMVARFNGTHRMSKSKSYRAWTSMKQRCYNSKAHNFYLYGGRGISVCDRWLESFQNFLSDMGEPDARLSLERKDNNGGYCKSNCYWGTSRDQSRNKRTTLTLTVRGHTGSLAELAEIFHVPYQRTNVRIQRYGWPPEQAFFTPRDARGPKRTERPR